MNWNLIIVLKITAMVSMVEKAIRLGKRGVAEPSSPFLCWFANAGRRERKKREREILDKKQRHHPEKQKKRKGNFGGVVFFFFFFFFFSFSSPFLFSLSLSLLLSRYIPPRQW